MRIAAIEDRLAGKGAKLTHRARLLRHWLQDLPDTHGPVRLAHFLPRAVREEWPAVQAELAALAAVSSASRLARGQKLTPANCAVA